MRKGKQSPHEKELPTFSESSTANYMLKRKTTMKSTIYAEPKRILARKDTRVMTTKNEIPEFSKDWIQATIDSLKKGRASDSNGIRAEDMKACSGKTKEMMRLIFNEVLKQEDCSPTTC